MTTDEITDEITDAIARGSISRADALDQLMANGMSKEEALYLLRSMAGVDVIW